MAAKKKTKRSASRPRFLRITPAMQAWAAALGDEVETWPRVTSRPMFGLRAFYRGDKMFAAVPKTRCLGTTDAVIFKLKDAPQSKIDTAKRDPRVGTVTIGTSGWLTFTIERDEDLSAALKWFDAAYQVAK